MAIPRDEKLNKRKDTGAVCLTSEG
jgi:hypothetical protein